ncbi:dicarboxylate/amino acid:cation symporter [Deinococcus soli (ex Cha et al. 2016)]|jgi:aerobic C4-dicarboxylate transport protein|uniref:C4-dicarboxylate transport protein n=2 Tax=Deinococcus soli (ex Cha et al. 2016) TaxID=1309411 RepID=A0A0F7JP03_9DEIO|nr:dicarboxylate/amino acid:cation symporter [Deinococcus soli (ex Cha et al. 2016)]AKH17004.1 C4-dicarboxylate transporter [Deinococcus soli (ex Cha et al. 2016)]MDR6219625.1 aerobic C4-dicarboxylate transport protein [Deinococcus soli (ex Cha et al. 2016)]MDR6329774.1 aerobic C4-dicarboxylate transport protein [Deinococcus soli (ex Cha et al. 2016)]MDR6752533.1 aerobic C4-dicarboxylate transport protein [Deinococcus soli (ex Cha et al. 2016)]
MPKLFRSLYVQVLTAIVIGVLVGHFFPTVGEALKPLGDGFIKLIKVVIGPIIFCTVVSGVASMRDTKKIGRVGGKALLYFEVVTTAALLIGLVVVNLVGPGRGMNINPATLDTSAITKYTDAAGEQTVADFILHVIPTTFVSAFTEGDLLQVLLIALLSGFALIRMGDLGQRILKGIDAVSVMVFQILGFIMKLAPIGAFGAMAFTIGKYGVGSLQQLAYLMGTFYVTCALFVFVILNVIARLAGFSLLKFLRYIKEELLLVLGTSSSESALPRLMAKLEHAGANKSVVGLVVPTGYSFNLDGTSIYLTMAAVFIAQATNTNLSFAQEVALLGILLLTSKGAAGVTGSGFVVLAGTLAALGSVPVAGLALILGIDRFMSEGRAITNIIGNGVATLVVARSERALDMQRLTRVLNGEQLPPVNADVQAEEHGEGRKLGSAQPA